MRLLLLFRWSFIAKLVHSMIPKVSQEPSIALFSPFEGCHEIIDSMVKVLAERLSADVLVLDALELAKGEFGALGKGVKLCP